MMYSREDVLQASKEGRSPEDVARRRVAPTRRTFLQVSLAAGGGLLVSWTETLGARDFRPAAHDATSETIQSGPPQADAFQPNGYVRVDPNDEVTVWYAQAEMGEGTRTALSMLIVEELDAEWNRVRILDAPLDNARYGGQGSGGSDAVRSAWDRLRQAGAVARLLLVRAAAQQWNVPESGCDTHNGVVRHAASGRTARYGELASGAAQLPVPREPVPLKTASQYRLLGTRVPHVDARAIARGQMRYGIDVRIAGMKYAAMAKAPVFGGRPIRVDGSAAIKVPGVRQVVEVHGLDNPTRLMSGVAVVADSTWAAFKGREALIVDWSETEFAAESSKTLDDQARALIEKPQATLYDAGGVDDAIAAAAARVDNTFTCGFVSHATLEPHNCTADYRNGEVWIRGPLQMPASGRDVVARALGIPRDRVHVQSTRIGGGFGRRLLSDYAAEAAVVSRAIGAPVQIVDSRTGDLQHDYYRPMAVQRIRGAVDASGRVVGWDHVIASASRNAYRRDPRPPYSTETYGAYVGPVKTVQQMDPDLTPTRIPRARLRYSQLRTGVPTGAWRAPAHVVIAFAIESTLDELAALAKRSPVDLRLDFLGESADIPREPMQPTPYDPVRLARVIREAAERGGLGQRAPEGRARGFAAHYTFGGYCAQVVELSVDERKRVTIHKATIVGDCGQQVNVNGLEAQAQGGFIDGLGAAFYGDVPIDRGRAKVTNFNDYRLIRYREAPAEMNIFFVPGTTRPTGFGEMPVPPVAPAVANAIAALTGERIRQMPFSKAGYELGR